MNDPSSPLVLVTGSNGWLGSCVARRFRAAGWRVRELVRRPDPAAVARGEAVAYQLGDEIALEAFVGATALVHCAYDFSGRSWSEIAKANVLGSNRLLEAARKAGVERIVYISSMSSFAACKSLYGKAKLAIEAHAAELKALIVRPGLVYGDHPGAMVGGLVKQARNAKLLPLIGSGGQILYLVHEADLADLILRYVSSDSPAPATPVTAAHPEPWTFRRILEKIAAKVGRRLTFIPVPWRAVWLVLKTAESCGLRLGFRSDSLVSLVNQNPHPDFSWPAELGFSPRPFTLEGVKLE
jgi:nucleoside-diphosphate-sugar epimerase